MILSTNLHQPYNKLVCSHTYLKSDNLNESKEHKGNAMSMAIALAKVRHQDTIS